MRLLNKTSKRWRFLQQYRSFRKDNAAMRPELSTEWRDCWPQLNDQTSQLPFDAHYVYHTAWAARIIANNRPSKHVDISSYTYFSTLVSAFLPVEFYDYRPAKLHLSNLVCGQADLCHLNFPDRSIESISCMHTIEHIGLGRYGDPLDPNGDCKAFAELQRVLAHGGNLLVVVPVGKPRIQFNAHRIYDPDMIVKAFDELSLVRWALLPDQWQQGLLECPDPAFARSQKYGCGCFWFQRKSTS